MKKLSLLLIAFVSLVAFQSCKKETNKDATAQLTDDEVKAVVESDVATDDLLDMVDAYAFNDTASRSTTQMPSCVTQTITISGTSVIITWQFDANGCTMPNGNTYKGTVTITRDRDLMAHSVTGSITFDNFSVNDIQIEGTADFTRQLNADGNPEVTHNYDFTVTLPSGLSAQRSGTRTRVWAEGFGTPSRTDDVFLITGNAHIERFNGAVLDVEIVTPLRREVPCRFFVSGTVKITKNGQVAILDYGNGACDAEATLTLPNGNVRNIHL